LHNERRLKREKVAEKEALKLNILFVVSVTAGRDWGKYLFKFFLLLLQLMMQLNDALRIKHTLAGLIRSSYSL